MVGGEIIGVTRSKERPGEARCLCAEWSTRYPKGKPSYRLRDDKGALMVWVEEKGAAHIEVGDFLWWQNKYAMWTPKETRMTGRGPRDVKLPRTSCSIS